MRDCVAVGGDEHAARVLPQAQRGVLQLVVVEVAVKAHDDRAHVMVVLHHDARGQVDRLLAILLHKSFVCASVRMELLVQRSSRDRTPGRIPPRHSDTAFAQNEAPTYKKSSPIDPYSTTVMQAATPLETAFHSSP